ncbi:MAG: carbohydrate-binding domain-containing protein [Bacilli bacterium]|nr:carbohydrate-binding domain-containing protein [Bacilli bacterium]
MDIVKFKKNIFFKLILLTLTLFVSYTKVNAVQESVLKFKNNKIEETISGSGYKIKGTNLTINNPGVYRLTGGSVDGTITVKKGTKDVTIILDNLDLSSTKSAPLTINKEGAEVKLRLVGTSTLVDNEDPDNEFSTDPNVTDLFEGAAIKVKSESKLTISGDGTLNIGGNTKNGIKGGKLSEITINSGTINITATKSGLACDHKININGGNININALNEGIKLEPDVGDNSSAAELRINGGTITLGSLLEPIGEDGIQAIGNIYINNKPNISIFSGLDGIQTRSNFYMTNGILNIHTYEGHSATTFDKDVISCKGIKASPSEDITENATNLISITGGKITIDSSDDAIHSDGTVEITRGIVNIQSFDDGIHADSIIRLGTDGGLERDPEISIFDAYEGIEAGNIYIYSGKIKVITREDGINAAGGASTGDGSSGGEHYNPLTGEDKFAIYAYGGNVYINSGTDGYDANGSLYLRGGTHIVYSQGRGGTNSALDRDAHLVIDGATVFTSGSIGTNGVITNIETSQVFVDKIYSYDNGQKIAVKSDGNLVFNDAIEKDTEYIFFTSPTLSTNNSIETTTELDEDHKTVWEHDYDDGSIITPATPTTPGVIKYTCPHGYFERQTYFYDNDVIFNIYNKTNGNVAVTAGNITEKYDFVTFGVDEITIESDVDFYLISSSDNNTTFNKIAYTSKDENKYTFTLDQTVSQNLYVVYKGDANTSGYISAYDELLIRKSLLDPIDPLYRALGDIESIAVDVNGDGLINEDDITYIQNVQLHMRLNHEYISSRTSDLLKFVNGSDSVTVDGENDGLIDVYLKANQNISIDAFEAMFIENQYIDLVNIEPMVDTTSSGTEINSIDNDMLYLVNTNGFEFAEDDTIYKLTFKVDKDTPTGDYNLNLKVGVLTPHATINEIDFNLETSIHVDGVVNPFAASFTKDAGVDSIDIYYNTVNDYASPDENQVDNVVAYARNKTTGLYDISGSGQVNFRVNLKPGYVVSTVVVEPAANFEEIDGPSKLEHANTYKIKKLTGNVTVTITTKQAQEYVATFIKDNGIKQIDVYYTQDYTTPDEEDVTQAIARTKKGKIDISGDGQVNFRIITKPGYKIESVTANGSYKNLKGYEETGHEDIYRITKIAGDIFVDITSKLREDISIEIDNLDENYEYTANQITPEIIVKKAGTDVILEKDTDYTLTYGENKELGTAAGTITVSPVESSDYNFAEQIYNFNIIPYTLKRENVNVPSSIAITGSTLDPKIIVMANDELLYKDTDYTLTLYNLDGNVGENVLVTVQGINNYTGLIENIEIPIVVKRLQNISFDEEEITMTYGTNFIKTATLNEGDGNIIYASLTPSIASVNPFTGAVILNKKGTTIIKAMADETDNYAKTETQYILHVLPEPLEVINITASDKEYDGTTTADLSGYEFIGLVNDHVMVKDTDYTVEANFDNAEIGENKDVTVRFTILNGNNDKYELVTSEFTVKASIFASYIESSDVELDNDTFSYTGSEIKPNPIVEINGNILVKNTDYTVSYENNINVGTAYAVIEGIGNYRTLEPIKVPFTINQLSITPTIENIDSVTYNGSMQMPDIVVKYNEVVLVKDTDYTVTYQNNINAGSEAVAMISPVASSNYTFDKDDASASKNFTINPYSLKASDVKLEYDYIKYDGTEKEPNVTVTANGIKLAENIEFVASYSNNIDPTTEAKVTITPISSNYTNPVDVYFEITNKNVLNISGINNNQKITYTGEEVVLNGTINVANNPDNITKNDLTIKYYDKDDNLIDKPTNVGSYYVIYSYNDANNIGEYKVSFEITKAKSTIPEEIKQTFRDIENNPLSNITFETAGLSWVDQNELIQSGYNTYNATYVYNNDLTNYEPIDVKVTIYGKKLINITTSVDGVGGTISESLTNIVEGTEKEITITPNEGYMIKTVTVNGKEVGIENNKLVITTENKDITVIAKFEAITYDLNISGTNITPDPNGIIKVDYNSDQNITVKTAKGYKLTSVIINDKENINNVVNDEIAVNNVTENTNILIKAKKLEYEVTEGARQKYTINNDSEATFKINADYSLFKDEGKVYVDNSLVDKSNYTSKDGSTIITFNKNYLDNLKVGVHTLDVYLSDGGVAQTTFTIAKVTIKEIERETIINKANNFTNNTTNKTNSNNNKNSSNNIVDPDNNQNTVDPDENNSSNKENSKKTTKTTKNKQSNTNDNIMMFVVIGFISAIVIALITFFIIKRKNKDEKDDLI